MTHPETPTWPALIAQRLGTFESHKMLIDFLETINGLDIKQQHMRGVIAVIGQGTVFPERALLTSDQLHEELNKDISLLVCFDPTPYSSPEYTLNSQGVVAPKSEEIPKLPHGSVVYYPWKAQYATDYFGMPSHFVDTIMAFRIAHLGMQLESGLLQSIMTMLKTNGYFIGSGGTLRMPEDYYETLAADPEQHIQLIQKIRLPDDSLYGYPCTNHTGVILQKI